MAGGYADQPLGYLNDVMTVRGYLKARQAVESEYRNQDGVTVNPASPAARLLLEAVEAEVWRQLAVENE